MMGKVQMKKTDSTSYERSNERVSFVESLASHTSKSKVEQR
jgi:hypothetical protein